MMATGKTIPEDEDAERARQIAQLTRDQEAEQRADRDGKLSITAQRAAEADRRAVGSTEKQERDREREKFRPPRERPPAGHVFADNGTIERRGEPHFDVGVVTRGDALVAVALDHGPDFWAEPTDLDKWMGAHLEHLGKLSRGKRMPRHELDELRRGYEAATGWPVSAEWQRKLRLLVKDGLQDRQGRRRRPKGDRTPFRNSGEILRVIRLRCAPGTVPPGLTVEAIERVLTTATLGRGGGREGSSKRRVNVDNAIDELIRSLGQEPHKAE